ncbi:multicopper oxidase [Acrodontium crateriforme]|uniref:Multicopper oxidase n=1 Tax=Acrodontium crateriforme TaxID=150365 RepID=A0AAQ3MD04_9PEZI|nr:multicopper oxidase [Acrodontium crateriforme]
MRLPDREKFDEESKALVAPRQNRSRRWVVVLVAFLSTWAIASVLFARIHSTNGVRLSTGNEDHSDDTAHLEYPEPTELDTTDAFRLHPEDHRSRTPKTQHFTWRITKGPWRADGVLKDVYFVNGVFPGPNIEARAGDKLVIEVENGLSDEGLALHWHGLTMRGANDMDGAVGVTQDPIPAGRKFKYEVPIGDDESGTFWWHAHENLQRGEGLFGGLVIHKPVDEHDDKKRHGNDIAREEHLLLIGDWYHQPALMALGTYSSPGAFGNEPVPDSILLNGAGLFNCEDAVPARPLDCEDRAFANLTRLRIDASKESILRVVNVGSYAGFNLTMDKAQLKALSIDADFPVKSASAKEVGTLYPGQRVDILIQPMFNGAEPEATKLGVELYKKKFRYENLELTPLHHFPVQWNTKNAHGSRESREAPDELLELSTLQAAEDQSKIMPKAADKTIVLYAITQKLSHLDNKALGFINGTTWEAQSPHLLSLEREEWNKHQINAKFDYDVATPKWVDIILNNRDEDPHPFHIHGYDFWVLSTYSSTYNWGSYNPFEDTEMPGGEWNFAGAVRRDTVLVPRRGYAVLRMRADNPGLWMMHCHVLWHQATGMSMILDIR